jgi:hypothetical protein
MYAVGVRDRYTPFLLLTIKYMSAQDFDQLQPLMVRLIAEIGSVELMKLYVWREGNLNLNEGHALYASVYNGNFELTKYLLSLGAQVNLQHFNVRQKLFCLGLILMEGFAIVMFCILFMIWFLGILQTFAKLHIFSGTSSIDSGTSSKDQKSQNLMTFAQLTCMTVPSAVALTIMFRLVPFHHMCFALYAVVMAQKSRNAESQHNV